MKHMAKSIMIFFSKLFSMVFNYWSVGFQFTLMSVQLSQEAIVFRLFSILTTYILFKHREISILLLKKKTTIFQYNLWSKWEYFRGLQNYQQTDYGSVMALRQAEQSLLLSLFIGVYAVLEPNILKMVF